MYASSHSITFNPNKSKLLCYNSDLASNVPQVYLNGEKIPVVVSDKHLGNFISTNIADRNIAENVCDLYKRSNWIISDFRVCDSSTLDRLHKTYCIRELWDLNCKYVSKFKVAWRKIKRRIGGLPYKAHDAIIHNLSYNIDLQLDTRVLKLVHSCLNHCNSVCKSLLSAKLHCIKSTFAAFYEHLSYKYKICQDDWFMDINLLIGKMKVQFEKETQGRSNAHTIVELCAIRDGIANCDIMSLTEASKLIDLITLE